MTTAQVAIVTGAGSGIGRSTVLRLAVLGYRLAVVGRTERTLEETVEAVERSGSQPEMLVVPADLADAEQAASVVDLAVEQWGRVDVLVNNAGIVRMAEIANTDQDLLYPTFATNTFGPAILIAACWPHMLRAGGGCIVNVSSMAAVDPFPGLAVYAASKAALDSLTRSIRNEGASSGIRAFSVAPGAVETKMLRGLFTASQIARDQTLEPSEIAEVIVECIRGERDEAMILIPSGTA